jgi:hypothetical protein
MSKGFSSQFKVGEDFMNMAREGIQLAQTMKDAFASAFSNIVLGTESVGAAFRSMAQSIIQAMARIFAQKAAEMLLNMVFSAATSGASGAGGYAPVESTSGGFAFGGNMAAGGYIAKGRGGIDDVPAMLMRGEYVLNEKAVRSLGRHNLDSWNSGRFAQYASGGGVGSYSPSSLSANTAGNTYHFGDVNYTSGKGGASEGMDNNSMRDFQRQHKAMTISLIEEHERRRARMGR